MTDPVTAPARLASIAALDLTSSEARALLDAAAAEAAALLESPLGLVSIVLDGAQWFAGAHGLQGWLLGAGGTPVEWSFCAYVVRSGLRRSPRGGVSSSTRASRCTSNAAPDRASFGPALSMETP